MAFGAKTKHILRAATRSIETLTLRQHLRLARRSLTTGQQRRHAESVAVTLSGLMPFHNAVRIGIYLATDGELDPSTVLHKARGRRKRFYAPVLRRPGDRKLWFLPHDPAEPLRLNRYRIREPALRNGRLRLARQMDLLLVPLVGFDTRCHRIGMGGGYYDQTLSFLKTRLHWQRPVLIGIAHECQRVEHLEPNPWDVPLDLVVTDQAVYSRKP